jgi:hypothetical protein
MVFKNIAIILVFIVTGCEFPGEPERSFNKNVVSPQHENISFGDFSSNQHVAGEISFQVDTSYNYQLSRTYFYGIDKSFFTPIQNSKYTFNINTQYYSEGLHTIYCGYIDGTSNLGLLNLLSFPAKYDSLILFFDQTPPNPTLLSVTDYPGLKMNLKWEKNNDSNFYAYIIRRDGDLNNLANKDIDTIKDRNITNYDDFTIPMSANLEIIYNVIVSNRAEGVESNTVTTKTTNIVTNYVGDLKRPYSNNNLNEVYSLTGTGLDAFSTLTNSLVKQKILYYSTHFTFDQVLNKIYVATDAGIIVLNANDFSIETTFHRVIDMSYGDMMFTDARNRIYYIDYSGSSRLIVLDQNNGNFLAQYNMSFQLIWNTSHDRTKLYAYNFGEFLKYDLNTDSLSLIKTKNLNFYVDDIKVSPDDQYLYLKSGYKTLNSYYIYNRISKMDINSFNIIEEIYIPCQNTGILGSFCLNEEYLYFSAVDDYIWNTNPRIYEYKLSTKEITRSWPTLGLPTSLITSSDNKTLYFTPGGTSQNHGTTTAYIKLMGN